MVKGIARYFERHNRQMTGLFQYVWLLGFVSIYYYFGHKIFIILACVWITDVIISVSSIPHLRWEFPSSVWVVAFGIMPLRQRRNLIGKSLYFAIAWFWYPQVRNHSMVTRATPCTSFTDSATGRWLTVAVSFHGLSRSPSMNSTNFTSVHHTLVAIPLRNLLLAWQWQ